METLERVLAAHPFFSDLSPPHLAVLVGCATNVRFARGEILCRAGDQADHFFLLRAGKVALELSPPGRPAIVVETLHEGDVLGWSWLIPPYRWSFDAVALDETRALRLDGACLRSKCEADHDLGYDLLGRVARIVAQRLDAARLQLLDVYGPREGLA